MGDIDNLLLLILTLIIKNITSSAANDLMELYGVAKLNLDALEIKDIYKNAENRKREQKINLKLIIFKKLIFCICFFFFYSILLIFL